MTHGVQHQESANRFVIDVDGSTCVLDYRLDRGVMTITHTGVPPELGGRGLAGQLTEAAFSTARSKGWRVVPACSYAARWIEKHPEFKDLLA
ncbi:MAG: GNAT family N-acetyltransferase [Dokdonella sp.]